MQERLTYVNPVTDRSPENILSLKKDIGEWIEMSQASKKTQTEKDQASKKLGEDFYYDFEEAQTRFSECRTKATYLFEKLSILLEDHDIVPNEILREDAAPIGEIFDTLRDLSEMKNSNPLIDKNLSLSLSEKLDEIDEIVTNFEQDPDREIKDLDMKALSLRKLTSELSQLGALEREQHPLDFLSIDDQVKKNWAEHFGNRYSVPFDEFYTKVILNTFPEMKGNEEFRRFISDLVNFTGEENVSAYTWNLFVELAGSTEEFRALILENKEDPDFIREYLTALSDVI